MDSNKGQTAKDKYGNELRVGDAYDSSVDGEVLRCIGIVKSMDGVHIEGAEVWASPFRTTIELGCTRLAAEVAKLGEVGRPDSPHPDKPRLIVDESTESRLRITEMPASCCTCGHELLQHGTNFACMACACQHYMDAPDTFSDGLPVTEPSDWPEVTLDEMPGGGK